MKRLLTAFLAVLLVSATGCNDSCPYMTVNGQVITVKEFNEAMKKNMPPKEEQFPGIEEQVKVYTENQLIRKTVSDQLKAEYNIQLSEAEIDQIYNYFVLSYRRYPTLQIAEELFPYYENGNSKEDIRKMTAETLLQNKLVEAVYAEEYTKPTEDQIQKWYDEKKEAYFTVPKCYYVSQIYVEKPAEEAAAEAETENKVEGEETAETAKADEVTEEAEAVKETAAEKLYKELQDLLPNLTSEKAFMKSAAKYMKDNPYFNKKDYKANRGFIYISEETKEIDDLLKDVPENGVSAIFDYADYNAYLIFYVYAMIPEHTIELDQIRSFAAIETGMEMNRAVFEKFYEEKINSAEIVYNEADRLAAKEEIQLEDEEIDLPAADVPVVEDGINDSVMNDENSAEETSAGETAVAE